MNDKAFRVTRGSLAAVAALAVVVGSPSGRLAARPVDADDFPTGTPIKHVVVIFQENVSFDHYFGTYPHAKPNLDGTSYFHGPKDDTPRVNNLLAAGLIENNPNLFPPFRIDRSQVNTCDQDHNYGDEQAAFNGGLMNMFVEKLGCVDAKFPPGKRSVMGYFDGNTVTALWNYAQNFAMSDNFFGTSFGPSTPGLLNVVSGNTWQGTMMANFGKAAGNIAGGAASGSVIGDPDPFADKCSAATRAQIQMTGGGNVGELLSAKGITWGSFMGGFADCTAAHGGITGLPPTTDYIPHHAFFQYWQKTLNANHLPPSSVATIGTDADQANHEYDLAPFWNAIAAGHMPAVAYIKAPAFEDGHAGYSDPLDEQNFLVTFINKLQQTKEWRETAVFIAYDDSDGWYDHVMGPIVTQSNVADDALLGPGNCGTAKAEDGLVENGKCGLGPRFPFLVISPYARRNYVDHKTTELASIVRFIEDNWNLGRIGVGSRDEDAGTLNGMFDFGDRPRAPKLIMNPLTGQILKADHDEN